MWFLVVVIGVVVVGVVGGIFVFRSRKPCGHYTRYWRFGSTNQCLGCENVELLVEGDRLRVENVRLQGEIDVLVGNCLDCENEALKSKVDGLVAHVERLKGVVGEDRCSTCDLLGKIDKLEAIVGADDVYFAMMHGVGTRSEDVVVRIREARGRCADLREV